MKGVSDVIAVLLMLIITIALAGLAYSYITGVFSSRTSVVLTIDSQASTCSGNTLTVYVRNDGTNNATVTLKYATTPGASPTSTCGSSKTIAPGTEDYFTCTKSGGAGYYQVIALAPGSTARGQIYCSS